MASPAFCEPGMKLLPATLAVCLVSVLAVSPAAATPCSSGAPDAWFVGVVYDSAEREDFKLDVFNFERFADEIATTHCMPSSNVAILAFDGSWSYAGTTYTSYPAATEAAFRAKVLDFGQDAEAAGGRLFVFLSSHGIQYATKSCPGGIRTGGSLSALRSGGGHDGNLYDCELGQTLNALAPSVQMVVAVDCSFCGGFSDSFTAASGTTPDHPSVVPSGVVAANRIVITGCSETTECFGSDGGGVLYKYMIQVLDKAVTACDGWTAPGFPGIQGHATPVQSGPKDNVCDTSELYFAAVNEAYRDLDPIAIQEQFRIKYGFATLAQDIPFSL